MKQVALEVYKSNSQILTAMIVLLLTVSAFFPLTVAAQYKSSIAPRSGEQFERNISLLPDTSDRFCEECGQSNEQPFAPMFSGDAARSQGQPVDLKSLLKPRIEMSGEWQPESGGVEIGTYSVSAKMPLYPIFGPPPPMISSGYSLMQINAPTALDLPESLHEFSLGLGWMRKINDKWLVRFMISGAFATDLNNTGGDAWQVRGGGFGIYQPNERWSFALGAIATGRSDLPVLPAIGAIWEPSPELKIDMMLPRPKVSFLVFGDGNRQQWGYVGGGFGGGNWAYERSNGSRDLLNYNEWRMVLGWESRPKQPPGTFRPTGTRFSAEVGYVFDRDFEFESNAADISLKDSLLLRTAVSF